MSNDLLPTSVSLAISPRLQQAVESFLSQPDAAAYLAFCLPADLHREAWRVLDRLEGVDITTPADKQTIFAWLGGVARAVRNPPSVEDIRIRANAVHEACQDLPGWLFNRETRCTAMGRFVFFPAVADVREVLEEAQKPFLRVLRGLERVARKPPLPPVAEGEVMNPQRAMTVARLAETAARAMRDG